MNLYSSKNDSRQNNDRQIERQYRYRSTLFTNISGKKKLICCTAAQKNHNLQQYLQNTLSKLLNRDKNLSCLFLIKQLGSLIPKLLRHS